MSYSATYAFVLSTGALIGLALCPIDTHIVAILLFSMAFFSFLLISFYVFSNRKMLIKTGEAPIVDPVE